MKLWDHVNAINSGKGTLADDLSEYKPFLINRQLSYFKDTVFIAAEMNSHANLDKDMQHAFLINIVRPRKRFSKWAKAPKDADFSAVMEYFGYGPVKAKEALKILTDDDLRDLKKELEKGGKQ